MRFRKEYLAAAVVLGVMNYASYADAAFDENLNNYTLDTVTVEADATKDKFGNTVTEQSYYRTGGDVKVITREEIEKRHYNDVTDAIKRIPGVTFQNPGYRGGQYTYPSYNNGVAINGDTRVIVLVDGRRIDNSTGTNFGSGSKDSKTMVDINQAVNMNDIDKIEVIKGPGASIYGSDATGGVINIITRKGGEENHGSIDISTGSWKKHVYNLNYSGSAGNDKSWKYFVSVNRDMSGDTKYKDGLTGDNRTYPNTNYKEDGANIRIDKDFNDKQNLRIWYNHKNGKDGYPITAPDYRYWNETDWNRIIQAGAAGVQGNVNNPGYRNLFMLDALSGSFNAFRNNDLDITYTFDKDNGMESFVRFYDQKHHYWGRDQYQNWYDPSYGYVPFPGGSSWDQFVQNHPASSELTGVFDEENRGFQVQYGRSIGKNDILTSFTFDKSKTYTKNDYGYYKNIIKVKRDSVLGFIQDKIHITDKWDLTPAIRYAHYSDATRSQGDTNKSSDSSVTKFTPTINTEYAFDDTFSAYLGWAKIYRPLKYSDYSATTVNGVPLKDEEGDVWTVGLRKAIDDNTEVALHYDWTDMDNAITGYPVWNGKRFNDRGLNAKETKKSINLTLDHKFDDNWTLGLAYSHLKDEWKAKDGFDFDPSLGFDETTNVNYMINELRPANHYTANLSYEKGKWYTGLLLNYYTGINENAFTDGHFLILDWNLNYDINKDTSVYLAINNLTNEAYENTYSAYNGMGATPQPGRSYMVGVKYKF